MAEIYANNVSGALASAIDATQTSFSLEPGHNFFDPSGDWYRATLYTTSIVDGKLVEDNHEVVKVTAVAGDTVTVERGLEGTVGAFAAGTPIEHRLTAGAVGAVSKGNGGAQTYQLLDNVTGTVTLDFNQVDMYSVVQGEGDLTISITGLPNGILKESMLVLKRNHDYALSFEGVQQFDKNILSTYKWGAHATSLFSYSRYENFEHIAVRALLDAKPGITPDKRFLVVMRKLDNTTPYIYVYLYDLQTGLVTKQDLSVGDANDYSTIQMDPETGDIWAVYTGNSGYVRLYIWRYTSGEGYVTNPSYLNSFGNGTYPQHLHAFPGKMLGLCNNTLQTGDYRSVIFNKNRQVEAELLYRCSITAILGSSGLVVDSNYTYRLKYPESFAPYLRATALASATSIYNVTFYGNDEWVLFYDYYNTASCVQLKVPGEIYSGELNRYTPPAGINGPVALSQDGLTMFGCDVVGASRINQYSLSEPFNLSTAVDTGKSLDLSSFGQTVQCLSLIQGGSRLIIGTLNASQNYVFDLSTANDLGSADAGTVIGTTYRMSNAWFSEDGTKAALNYGSTLFMYSMSTPGDLNTLVLDNSYNGYKTEINASINAIACTKTGQVVLGIRGEESSFLWQFPLATPFDISTLPPVDDTLIMDPIGAPLSSPVTSPTFNWGSTCVTDEYLVALLDSSAAVKTSTTVELHKLPSNRLVKIIQKGGETLMQDTETDLEGYYVQN